MIRSLAAASLLALGLVTTAAPAFAQGGVVIRSSTGAYRPGQRIAPDAPLNLTRQDVLILVVGDGTRTICGPSPVTLAASAGRCTRALLTSRPAVAAVRSIDMSEVAVTERIQGDWDGTVCLGAADQILLFDPPSGAQFRFEAPSAEPVAMMADDLPRVSGDWLAWPQSIPVGEGTRVTVTSRDRRLNFTIRQIGAFAEEGPAMLAALTERGCASQVDYLLSSEAGFDDETQLAYDYILAGGRR